MMRTMKKKLLLNLLDHPRHWPVIFWGAFIVAAGISLWALLSFHFWGTHDDNVYEIWLNSFDELIRSGQLFPALVKDFWFEHGSPTFVFYPPLFFYLAAVPRL